MGGPFTQLILLFIVLMSHCALLLEAGDGDGYNFDLNQRIAKGFAVKGSDGRIYAWGGGDVTTPLHVLTNLGTRKNMHHVFSTETAYMAVNESGAAIVWGDQIFGGNMTSVAHGLRTGVSKVFSTRCAFLALTEDGQHLMWGANKDTRDTSFADHIGLHVTNTTWWRERGQYITPTFNFSNRLDRVFTNRYAFAATTYAGELVTFGDNQLGGDGPVLTEDESVVTIGATLQAFAAVTTKGRMLVWGSKEHGGNIKEPTDAKYDIELSTNIFVDVRATATAFAGLTSTGRVVTWGAKASGGNSINVNTKLRRSIYRIVPNYYAFAALSSSEAHPVVTWGVPTFGGTPTEMQALNLTNVNNPVVEIYAARQSFCALRQDRTVIPWGNPGFGGDFNIPGFVGDTIGDVERVIPNPYGFVVLLTDRTVMAWGHMERGANLSYSFGTCGDKTLLGSKLLSDRDYVRTNCPIVDVVPGETAFAFVTDTGGIIVTGNMLAGANMTELFEFDEKYNENALGWRMATSPLGERDIEHMNFSALVSGAQAVYGTGSTNVNVEALKATAYPSSMPSGQPTSMPTVPPPLKPWLVRFWLSMNPATQFLFCLFMLLSTIIFSHRAWKCIGKVREHNKISSIDSRLQAMTPTARQSMMVGPGEFNQSGIRPELIDRFGLTHGQPDEVFISPADQVMTRQPSRVPERLRVSPKS